MLGEIDNNLTLIALIGYRGTGKSTVARILADRLGWNSMDCDVEIERRAEKSIKQIFDSGGESAFRNLESAVIADASQLEHVVISTGGGAVLRPQNRAAMRRGCVVWLTADPQTIEERVNADPASLARRPNLTTAGGLEEIKQLLAVREPLYRECADCTVNTVGKTPEHVVDEIVCFLNRTR